MIPETWLPTWTVVTAEIVPVAVTVIVTSPRSTVSVWNSLVASDPAGQNAKPTPTPAATRTNVPTRSHRRFRVAATCRSPETEG